jgi:peptidoglycan/xylan/chitin deacetylase (PgdA/CDA1 family)
MKLQQLTQALQDRKCPYGAVVVTFDDGYANNLHNAKPLLEHYDVPATFFLTIGSIKQEREFWWDELDRLLLQPGRLPAGLRLSVTGSTYQWELGEAVHYSKDEYQRHRPWSASEKEIPSPRHSLYRSLYSLLYPMLESDRLKVMDKLLVWAGAEPASRSTHRSLSLEEVVALNQGELFEIGSHTVTHPLLPALPAAWQQDEIQRNKACLEEIVGQPVSSFAYPYGDYTAETVALVREAGFARACSTNEAAVWRRNDRFELPRFHVEDWDGEEFARQLSRWFHV